MSVSEWSPRNLPPAERSSRSANPHVLMWTLGLLRPLRGSRFAFGQPDACISPGPDRFHGRSRGGWAIGNTGSLSGHLDLTGARGIRGDAFRGCVRLTRVTIPDSVTGIGRSAFAWCSGLTSVTIGSGVTSIGKDAYNGCGRITNILFEGNAPTVESGAFASVRGTACVRKSSTGWRVKIPGTWEGIAIRYCDSPATPLQRAQRQTGGRSGSATRWSQTPKTTTPRSTSRLRHSR